MSPIRSLFSLGILLSLVACGSTDNDPPSLQTNDLGERSPFDTLQINFDKNIELPGDSSVSATSPMEMLRVKGKTLYIIGADTVLSGLPVLEPGKARHEIKFKNIKDTDGYVNKKEQTITFATYPLFDKDGLVSGECIDNGTPQNAEALADSVKFFDNTSFANGLTFSAMLSGNYNDDCPDLTDYFRVFLKAKDTLYIETSDHSMPLTLSVKGPRIKEGLEGQQYQPVLTIESTAKKPLLDTAVYISADIHSYGTDLLTEHLAYYIQISYPSTDTGKKPSPYTLTVRRGRQ
ncbi:MAG: hypothetical protein LBR60_00305 [Fibrobacter sp.]|jgi:hypothetical protein|nr:hypothetical protein [Fibrobacter sp.]